MQFSFFLNDILASANRDIITRILDVNQMELSHLQFTGGGEGGGGQTDKKTHQYNDSSLAWRPGPVKISFYAQGRSLCIFKNL